MPPTEPAVGSTPTPAPDDSDPPVVPADPTPTASADTTSAPPAKAAPIRPGTGHPAAVVGGAQVAAASALARDDAKVPMVPMSEVVFLPDGPARVATFAGHGGTVGGAAALTGRSCDLAAGENR